MPSPRHPAIPSWQYVSEHGVDPPVVERWSPRVVQQVTTRKYQLVAPVLATVLFIQGGFAPPTTNAPATQAAVSVVANDATTTIKPVAGPASVSVTANPATASVAPVAGQAPVTVTAFNATVTVKPVAGLAAVSVSAFDATTGALSPRVVNRVVVVRQPLVRVPSRALAARGGFAPGAQGTANATLASVTVTSYAATTTVKPVAGQAAVTVAGFNPTPAVAPVGGLASVAVTANQPTTTIAPVAGQAAVAVTAYNATTSSALPTRWQSRAVVVRQPSRALAPGAAYIVGGTAEGGRAAAGTATVSVTAFNATVSTGAGPRWKRYSTQIAHPYHRFEPVSSVFWWEGGQGNLPDRKISRVTLVRQLSPKIIGSATLVTGGFAPPAPGQVYPSVASVTVTAFNASTTSSGPGATRWRNRTRIVAHPYHRFEPLGSVFWWEGGRGNIPDRVVNRATLVQARYGKVTFGPAFIQGGFAGPRPPGTSDATPATVSVVAFSPHANIIVNPTAAAVSVTAFNATTTQGTAAQATQAAVAVTAYPATAKVAPGAQQAAVGVTAFNATTTGGVGPVNSFAYATCAFVGVKAFDATTRHLRGNDKVWPVQWWTPKTWVSDIGITDLNRYVRDNIKSMRQKQVMDIANSFQNTGSTYTNAAPFKSGTLANVVGCEKSDLLSPIQWGVVHEPMVMLLFGSLQVTADGTSGIPTGFTFDFIDNTGNPYTAGSFRDVSYKYPAPAGQAITVPFIAVLDGPVTYGYQLQMSVDGGGLYNIGVYASIIVAPKTYADPVATTDLVLDDVTFGLLDFNILS